VVEPELGKVETRLVEKKKTPVVGQGALAEQEAFQELVLVFLTEEAADQKVPLMEQKVTLLPLVTFFLLVDQSLTNF
jgi:hypothetical protein